MAQAPRVPYFGKILGGLSVLVAAAGSAVSSGVLDQVAQLAPVISQISKPTAAVITTVCAVIGWLARAPIGKR